MDVFDEGAIIIFISAEEASIGEILSANNLFFKAFGYEKDQILGQTVN